MPVKNDRAKSEVRKLLSHVLVQLANRIKPPSIVDVITNVSRDSSERGIGAFAETLKDAVKRGGRDPKPEKSKPTDGANEDDSDENDVAFTTDSTISLMMQLKDVLTMAIDQGWQIFDENYISQPIGENNIETSSSALRKSRSSFRPSGKRSRLNSLHKCQDRVPELLSSCISILESIVSEDCRYRVAFPRPSLPPHTLQAMTLNIAQFLIYSHRHDPRIISAIAFAMIPAFYTFSPHMHPRLLSFFESSVIGVILHSLNCVQGMPSQEPHIRTTYDPALAVSGLGEFPIVSIQIDDVQAHDRSPQQDGCISISSVRSIDSEVQSTNNPQQSSHIYYLAFLIPPLMAAILESLETSENEISYDVPFKRVIGLLRKIATSKIDAYNDLLEIVAYRGPKPRRFAVASLAALWSKSVGHTVISSPFCPKSASELATSKLSHPHQFIPWYFESVRNHGRNGGYFHDDCRSCLKPMQGFSLMCPSCMTAVHFDCYDYPEGNYQLQYTMEDNFHVQGMAMGRYSQIQMSTTSTYHKVGIHNHDFAPANWFTLCVCFICYKPLWGCFAQGVKCGQCPTVLHVECLPLLSSSSQCSNLDLTSKVVTMDWNLLRQSCLEHFPFLRHMSQQLNGSSYEEVVIYHNVLRTQLQILNNGVAFGTIVIRYENNTSGVTLNDFELHNAVNQTKHLLELQNLQVSPLTQQYMRDSNIIRNAPSIMFNWSFLEYITAAIKTSPQSHTIPLTNSDFLNVEQRYDTAIDTSESPSLPYESTSLMHMRSILGADFALRSDDAAKFMLDHLHHLAFFERMDGCPYTFQNMTLARNLKCIFPLPLGLDLSMNVETLVSSIEASLSDLDLSTNEFGFLLLTRRFWPNGLASEYGLKRLAMQVLSWILAEDDSLATILREFVAKQRNLPGVRSDLQPWPSSLGARSGSNNLASNGGDFVSARRALLSRFAFPWLSELHELDPIFYGQIVFDSCYQFSEESDIQLPVTDLGSFPNKNQDRHLARCDEIMRSIIKLAQFSVVFTAFDDIFLRWADFAHPSEKHCFKAIPSLHRLFLQENEPAQSSAMSPLDMMTSPAHSLQESFVDPLRSISNFANQSEAGLPRTLSYLPMIIRSGVNIPVSTFKHFLALITANKRNSLDNANMLVRAILLSLWLKSTGRQDLQDLLALLHSALSSQISQCLVSGKNPIISLSIIRQSLAACLRIYGCDRNNIIAAGIVSATEVDHLPSRRKLAIRGSVSEDPIVIHPDILNALDLYMQSRVDDVTCHVANFLNIFLTNSPFLEGFEIDNFILRSGKIITSCAWATYNIQREDVAVARTSLLLRSLIIDSEPFQELLFTNMNPATASTNKRLSSITRLFRMISDVTSPAFNVDGRQWRSSVIQIFNSYFSALWADPSEEVRLAVKSSCTALLPVHFDTISQCWSEFLSKAPITERIRLIAFLIQLHAHFTTWKVLSWNCMIETLTEYDYDPKGLHNHLLPSENTTIALPSPDYRVSTADPEMEPLRASIIFLGLQMIGDGIEIDSFSLTKLKIQLVQIVGFKNISVIQTQSLQSLRLQFSEITQVSDVAFPCIEELTHVVDSPHYLKVHQSALGITSNHEDDMETMLVGSVFIDIVLYIMGTLPKLSSLPVLTLKCLLETLYIIVHKYDFDDPIFRHLQSPLGRAILRSSELLSQDLSYELRQLSLSIAQASITKWHTFLGPTISIILELVASEVAFQSQNSQDSLIVHGKLLIRNTLQLFCSSGLLLSLLRRPLQPSFFNVLRQVFYNVQGKDLKTVTPNSICDSLLRDTLNRAVDCDSQSFQMVLQNVLNFIQVVYFQGYSQSLMAYCGQHLSFLARRMSDGSMEGLDPSPLISISAILIQNNRKNSKDLLPHVEVVLRVALNRLGASESSLQQLIKAVVSSKNKGQGKSGSVDLINVLFDILLDGFRMKTKILPLMIKSLVESLLFAEKSMILSSTRTQKQTFSNMVDDAYNFLQNHPWNEESIDNDFQAIIATGKIILEEINRDPTHFQRFTEPLMDKSPRYPLTLRSWNILLLITLQNMDDDWQTMIYDNFHSFTSVYSTMLRQYVSSGLSSAAMATTDINQAHIALRLWLMLGHSISTIIHNGETVVTGIWNQLWPPFEGLLNVLETEARVGLNPAVISLASTSVADLLLYLRSLSTSLSLDTSAHIAILNRLRILNHGESSLNKAGCSLLLSRTQSSYPFIFRSIELYEA
ncbi:hypothetical protein BDN70DRAFT_800871 [Pholiota conissans]|uniref:Phorbol-ester/DAG-type domain-containing protein n=1 Tax=Pholiota conissans TaxID=109636 RepID=A0A9P6CXB7_9AGAR|nr:hypothetical protein BDN70DRAFT_800871 [Pholiota conissans]